MVLDLSSHERSCLAVRNTRNFISVNAFQFGNRRHVLMRMNGCFRFWCLLCESRDVGITQYERGILPVRLMLSGFLDSH